MFLKALHLKNIRSYTEASIRFPAGSLLIEGDIGSGKSTLLLAIDFALFGARPNELPASSLLRNGTNRGEVVLEFALDGKDVEIKRVLEKKGGAIAQTAGYITVNGTRRDLMSSGLKSIVFELLGYPKADIRAGKSVIYRYTVYTPQEQMKQILLQKPDDRLNTIRSIFNIDKYKRIRENAKLVVREMKRSASHFEGVAYDLKEKQEKMEALESQKKMLENDLKNREAVHEKISANLESKKREKEAAYSELKKLNSLVNELTLRKARLENDEKMFSVVTEEIARLEKKLESSGFPDDGQERISGLERECEKKESITAGLRETEEEIRHTERKITETLTRMNASLELAGKVTAMSECPTCRQEVTAEHKERIGREEDEKAAKFEKILKLHREELDRLKKKYAELGKSMDEMHEREKMLVRLKSEFEAHKSLKESMAEKKEKLSQLASAIEEARKALSVLEKDAGAMKDAETKAGKIESELEVLNAEYTLSVGQIEKARQQMESAGADMAALSAEVEEKLKARKEAERLDEITNWLKDYFIPLNETMERHIMLSIQRDFDALFSDWFNILIDDDNLQARIDAEFSPVIEQNSYETSYEYLSGGEKTSVALAYRLALNKIINNISDDIKTKDLLILDEPTDGFSSEQLDKVRDVLQELRLKQTIIVSHEEKIESFVDRTIRVVKEDHSSRIVG